MNDFYSQKEPFFTRKKVKEVAKNFFSFALDTLLVIGVVVLVRTFIFSPFSVVGDSMQDNLIDGDLILIDKISQRFSNFSRGDVVVFFPPEEKIIYQPGLFCLLRKMVMPFFGVSKEKACYIKGHFVKRVIGLPGDIVEIRDGKVFITPAGEEEKKLASDHFLKPENQGKTWMQSSHKSDRDDRGVIHQVPENTVFVLGDNRRNSSDSRSWEIDGKPIPFVPFENISGKVRVRFWPLTEISIIKKESIFLEE